MIECDIVGALDGPVHLRALARRLGKSPSYLHRKVHELAARGIVDIQRKGKTVQIVPLRENPLFSCYQMLGRHLERERRFGPYARTVFKAISILRERLGPDLIGVYVFGSVAEGRWAFTNERRSDLDLLVITRELPANIVARTRAFLPISERLLVEEGVSVDIAGYDIKDLAWSDPLLDAVRRSGILVYGEAAWT